MLRMYHQPLVRAACAVAFGLVRLSGRRWESSQNRGNPQGPPKPQREL